jgi:integrase/recombinase XerD
MSGLGRPTRIFRGCLHARSGATTTPRAATARHHNGHHSGEREQNAAAVPPVFGHGSGVSPLKKQQGSADFVRAFHGVVTESAPPYGRLNFEGDFAMDATKLKNQIKKFEEHLIVDEGLSRRTVDNYARALGIALRRMRKFCPSEQDIRKFILWMHEKQYSYSHIVNTSLAVEHYAKFKGMTIALGRPRKPKRIIQNVLSESEVSRMIQATKNAREKAVFCLLAYSGVRNSELRNIRRKDIDLGANQLNILGGKNKKDRVVNISGECTKIMIDYLSIHHKTADDFLFATLKHGHPLAEDDLRKMVRVLAQRANIGRRVFPHLLRHSLATNLLNRGASLIMIKDQLGHAFIDSTMIYVTSMPFRARSEYDFYKPAYM